MFRHEFGKFFRGGLVYWPPLFLWSEYRYTFRDWYFGRKGELLLEPEILISGRKIGRRYPPFVIAEIGINHEGNMEKAKRMIDDAASVGCECVKFQSHIIEDEMSSEAKRVIPANADESIWDIMNRCALGEEQERELKEYAEQKGLVFLSTPFSRAAAFRLEKIGVSAYKIGSGECNNYPLIEVVASFKKPVILSTGMNDIVSISKAVEILRKHNVPFALLHCTSMYPTPYEKIRLGALSELQNAFSDAVIGLSDHSESVFPAMGAVALGASILERHFTSDLTWDGPDIPISMTPDELKMLVEGSRIIHKSLGGEKRILEEEAPTIAFAYASVVAIAPIEKGSLFSAENLWVKRPGTGEILAEQLYSLFGKRAVRFIPEGAQVRRDDVEK
ncbi:MAG: polyhydroxyalkanoate biosynthesis repressor PhaR [Bacteroidia bacterium]|nr:polyhydroxyalkanoate biosynthesis repressor PhaR [Bacteroidia bacterium]